MTDQMKTPGHDVEDEAHRASCDECSAVWLDLEHISAEAAQLPLLSPSRDLWAGIEARIDAPVVAAIPRSESDAAARRGWLTQPRLRLAIAASLLVATTAGITWGIARQGMAGTSAPVTASQDAVPVAVPGQPVAQLASFENTVAGMDREIAQLETIVQERGVDLDPRTIAVLRANLAVIDAAIRESRAALAADPASRFLTAQVTRAYQSKLTLLRGAATLPTGI